MKHTRHFTVSLLMIICLLQLQILPHLVYAEDLPEAGGVESISAEEISDDAEASEEADLTLSDDQDSIDAEEEIEAQNEEEIVLAEDREELATDPAEEQIICEEEMLPDQEESSEEEIAKAGGLIAWATKNIYVGSGCTIDLEVCAYGTGLSYQWQWASSKSGPYTNCSSAGATSKKFSFTVKTSFHGRYYRCRVRDGYGLEEFSTPTGVYVDEIAIMKYPDDVKVPAGGQATFHVEAQGEGLTYQWRWSGDGGKTWNKCTAPGCNTDTFTFKASSALFGRYYYCSIYDKHGYGVGTPMYLLSEVPKGTLEITTQPENNNVDPGYKCYFHCYASGDGVSYQWQWATSANGKYTNATSAGSNSPDFIFLAKGNYNGRFYRCQITDRSGKTITSQPAELYMTFRYGPTIYQNPADNNLMDGEVATFSVGADGSNLKYQWQWAKTIDGAYTDNTSKGYNSASFSFNTKLALSGRYYRCRITDSVGNVKYSEPAALTVTQMPIYIISQPQDQSVEDGQRVEFYVDAKGKSLKYQWQWSSTSYGPWTNNTSTGYDLEAFDFTTKPAFNGRYYRCRITDGYGQTYYTRAAKLEVRQIPLSIIKDPEYRGVGIGEKVTFYIVARGKNVTYQWQWSDGNGTWNNCSSAGCNTDSFSFTSKMAFNGRLYRCRVKDAYGNIAYSSYARLGVFDGVG